MGLRNRRLSSTASGVLDTYVIFAVRPLNAKFPIRSPVVAIHSPPEEAIKIRARVEFVWRTCCNNVPIAAADDAL
jgi:hypothetical protein